MWPCPLISKTSDSVIWVAIYRVSLQLPTQANYNSFDSQSCIMSPFAILYTGQTGTLNMVANESVYDISGKDCYLTNCINSSIKHSSFSVDHPTHCYLLNFPRPGMKILSYLPQSMVPMLFQTLKDLLLSLS